MADYIKRIQSRLSRKNIKQPRAVLIDAIASLGFDHTKLTEGEVDNLTDLLVDKFKVDYERGDKEAEQKSDCANPGSNSQLPIPQPKISENLVNEPDISEILQPPEPELEAAKIVVSPEQKQELIANQASGLGVELSSVEVVEVATSLKDSFLDHDCFIEEVITAVVKYNDHRSDSLERKIKDARTHIENRRNQLNKTFVGEFGEMNNFFRSQSAKRKELSAAIAAAFKI
ncbi:MAG: hypothetical protein HC836_30475 [Richelia sp. RM2_1_2]|nr:hypothetical protein [Richelia sp. RM2_1_2]